jgi:hypothetical protein
MKKLLLTTWCLLPFGAGAYHYGPGLLRLELDATAAAVDAAERSARAAGVLEGDAARAEWAAAVASYDEALNTLPSEHKQERWQLVLERAKAKLLCSKLPEANAELGALLEELAKEPAADAEFVADVRRSHAGSEYYMTWLLRLEGAPQEEWEPRIENARQSYKLLAEQPGLAEAEKNALAEDVESAVRLARMDLEELQGLPLPSQ